MEQQSTRIRGLTRMNVRAVSEVFRRRVEAGEVELGKTYAVFHFPVHEALEMVTNVIAATPGRGHPKASLHAIKRKLIALAPETDAEQLVREEEEQYQEQQVEEFVVPEDTTGSSIDPAALFLTELTYPNMFESRGPAGTFCKVCGEQVERTRHEAHHAGHKRDRANHQAERIRQGKESSMAKKAPTATPLEQGFPAVYLNEDGSKFKPGGDAQAKSDAVKTILALEHGYEIDLTGRKAELTADQAKKLLAARGWNAWLIKAKDNIETKLARQKAQTETKKQKVKDEVAAKRQQRTAKPDPKPARRARGRRSAS